MRGITGIGVLNVVWKGTMGIHIKNEDVRRRTGELAGALGTTLTGAVALAVQEKLVRVREQPGRREMTAKLAALGAKCAQHAPKDWVNWDYDGALYDGRGWPR
jgi:antitoxin VapB